MGAGQEKVTGFGRLEDGSGRAGDWYRWGPYLSERQWGAVREDYSADGEAWSYLPHDHARSRAYRWGEDGLAGFCDAEQRLCLSLALWNGRDPILKERAFGLTGAQGNHGEDVKEYWWYLDATPSHAWNRWRYHYPQAVFPYQDLIDQNAARNRWQPEFELADTGVFDSGRYWVIEVHYAKANPDDLLMAVSVTNAGPVTETLHVLPTCWFRNTWSWEAGAPRPTMAAAGGASVQIEHPVLGLLELIADCGPDGAAPAVLFCENETNTGRLFGTEPVTPYPKDGINDYVVHGASTVNPERTGTKCAFWYEVTVPPGETAELRLRLRPAAREAAGETAAPAFGCRFAQVMGERRAEADEFYAKLTPCEASADEAMVMRQAFAGMLWGKQFFYHVRNSHWDNLNAFDILSVPDKWEYPWFAAWDLAFHCVALAHVDPAFAKHQLILLSREWFQHPNGALPAYEWGFGDLNPPVLAWAALEVFAIDGGRDIEFLSRVFDKLLANFNWWVNREGARDNNAFEGGFRGLDSIGLLDRSHLPANGILEQPDATGWTGFYAIAMAGIATVLSRSGQRPASDLVLKFMRHLAAVRDTLAGLDLWDEADGLYYDRLITPSGAAVPVKVRSMVSLIPALAPAVIGESEFRRSLTADMQFADLLARRGPRRSRQAARARCDRRAASQRMLLSLAGPDRLERVFGKLFDEEEFLSPHGLRALSAYHREHPCVIDVEGVQMSVRYEPAEAATTTFGGNSNWRGPIWFPLNYLMISVLERYQRFFEDDFTIEYPTGSGRQLTLDKVAADLEDRLISLFTRGSDGRRPCFGGTELLQTNPLWHDNLIFSEYFHGDNGAAIGAFHQTGWTGVIADVIRRRHGQVDTVGDIVQRTGAQAGDE